MKGILKPIFEWIVDQYTFFENPLLNLLVALLVGEIAYRLAFSYVGSKYRTGEISGKSFGSILHWLCRFVIYTSITAIIWIVRFVINLPNWVWLIIGGVVAALLISTYMMLKIYKVHNNPENFNSTEEN